jgi:hypothetical protein
LPEIEGKSPVDEYDPFKADVFSVGVCLLQSLKTMFQSLVQKFRNNELQDIERRVKIMSSCTEGLIDKNVFLILNKG